MDYYKIVNKENGYNMVTTSNMVTTKFQKGILKQGNGYNMVTIGF